MAVPKSPSRKSPFAAVPEIGDDAGSVRRVLEALKQNVELLLGQRGTVGTKQSIVYRQKEGEPAPVGLSDGDQWWQPPVVAGEDWRLSIFWNGKWHRV